MKYRDARKLHNEDEVIRKSDGRSLYVVSTMVDKENRVVSVFCDDGLEYNHLEIH